MTFGTETGTRNAAVAPDWVATVAVGVFGVALLLWSWGKWLHPIVDFGRELYVPWQILEGRGLYADLSYFNGPLSPWINSISFRFFGVGLSTVVWLNVAVLAGVLGLLFRLLRRFGDLFTATCGCVVFLACFAFADPTGSGTYNFVAPYSHEMTHGFLLTLVALTLALRFLERPATPTAIGLGATCGLVFLTKSELFVAIAPIAVLAPLLSPQVSAASEHKVVSRGLLAQLVGLIAALGGAFLALLATTHAGTAAHGLLGSWRFALSGDLHQLSFYRGGMGMLDPLSSAAQMMLWTGVCLAILVPAWLLSRQPIRVVSAKLTGFLSVLVAAALTAIAVTRLSVLDVVRPAPLVVGLAVLGFAYRLWADRGRRDVSRQAAMGLLCSLFALLLLLKIFLRVRLAHYGFVLAAPATMLLIWLLIDYLPAWIERKGGRASIFRASGTAFLTIVVIAHLSLTARSYSAKAYPVGDGEDAFLADSSAVVVRQTLDRLEALMQPLDSLAVLPEGVMLNYLLRRPNPTPYYNFMPPELVMFGESSILDAFRAEPPDWIVMTGRGATEYGFEYLGRGYGDALASWVRGHYDLVERVGTESTSDPTTLSWTMILRRRS